MDGTSNFHVFSSVCSNLRCGLLHCSRWSNEPRMIFERTFSSTITHPRSQRHAAWRLIWDHIQVQCMPLTPYSHVMLPEDSAEIIYRYSTRPSLHIKTPCCLETQLRSYTGTVNAPYRFSERLSRHIQMSCCLEIALRSYTGSGWRLSWYLQREAFPPTEIPCK